MEKQSDPLKLEETARISVETALQMGWTQQEVMVKADKAAQHMIENRRPPNEASLFAIVCSLTLKRLTW